MESNGYGLFGLVTRPGASVGIPVALEMSAHRDCVVSGSRIVKQACHASYAYRMSNLKNIFRCHEFKTQRDKTATCNECLYPLATVHTFMLDVKENGGCGWEYLLVRCPAEHAALRESVKHNVCRRIQLSIFLTTHA
jgi:hypothetical protein